MKPISIKPFLKRLGVTFILMSLCFGVLAQNSGSIKGSVISEGKSVPFANVVVKGNKYFAVSDEHGKYEIKNVPVGTHVVLSSAIGFNLNKNVVVISESNPVVNLDIKLEPTDESIEEVVVTGTMKETYIEDSPIKVEVLSPRFLEKIPTNNIIEAIQTVNGVQEQINCGVCATNDIHINGMEGPYTLVLIDGMPIISALASVYGFNGIPNSLIKRVEIVKGPASSLYGSEAVGGVINIITKDPYESEKFSFNTFMTSHGEFNLDAATTLNVGKKASSLLSANYYYNNYRMDFNGDNFTDIPLNNRLSVFNKWSFKRKKDRRSTIAARFYTEDRFGGVMNWQREHRGGDQVYGESIYTSRGEVIGSYQLPIDKEHIRIDYSGNIHDQNSYYGNTLYDAKQAIGFANFIWDKSTKKSDLLIGATTRYQYYDDNTPATVEAENRFIPGIFVQDEIKLKNNSSLLIGGRVDHHQNYGFVPAPRVALKFKPGTWTTGRVNFGRGFRLVNLFTEDHAALTGARTVVIADQLQPEQSYNANLNINHVYVLGQSMGTLDFDVFYTTFSNKIIPDYETDQNLIIYDNLDGSAVVRGFAASVDQNFVKNFKFKLGATYQEVYEVDMLENGNINKIPQLLTPRVSGTFVNSYKNREYNFAIDWTGRIMGRQHLPTFDPPYERPEVSQIYSIQNLQITKSFKNSGLQIYGGVRNLLNFTQDSPLVAWQDPFGDDFDTSYAYAPVQTRRYFIGVRFRPTKKDK